MNNVETKYWIHPDGFLYVGDKIDGAREANEEEIAEALKSNVD